MLNLQEVINDLDKNKKKSRFWGWQFVFYPAYSEGLGPVPLEGSPKETEEEVFSNFSVNILTEKNESFDGYIVGMYGKPCNKIGGFEESILIIMARRHLELNSPLQMKFVDFGDNKDKLVGGHTRKYISKEDLDYINSTITAMLNRAHESHKIKYNEKGNE